MIDELYYKGILDDKDIDIIQNNKNINKDKNDGFERWSVNQMDKIV